MSCGCKQRFDYAGRDVIRTYITAVPDTVAYSENDLFAEVKTLEGLGECASCTGDVAGGTGQILEMIVSETVAVGDTLKAPKLEVWILETNPTSETWLSPNDAFELSPGDVPPESIIGIISVGTGDWKEIDARNGRARINTAVDFPINYAITSENVYVMIVITDTGVPEYDANALLRFDFFVHRD